MKEKLKGFFKILKSRILLIISICFSFTMLGYFISSNFICDISYNSYTVECRYSESLSNYEDLINQDSLEYAKSLIIEIRQEAIDNGEKAPYSDFSYVDIKSFFSSLHFMFLYFLIITLYLYI